MSWKPTTAENTSCTAIVPYAQEEETVRQTTTRSTRTSALEKKSTRSAARNDSSSRGPPKLQRKGSSKIKLETRKRLQILSMMRKSTEPKGPKTRDKMVSFFDSFFEREENRGKFTADDKERFKQEFFQNFGEAPTAKKGADKRKASKASMLPALEWHKETSTPRNNATLSQSSQISAVAKKNKRRSDKSPSVRGIDNPPRTFTGPASTKARSKGPKASSSKAGLSLSLIHI